ncbi:MAG: hypothetical protein ACSHX0_06780 [Akkermansiaceae bacterium]
MKFELELNDEQRADLAKAVVDDMVSRGVALAPPPRLKPYSVSEAAEELSISVASVRRDVEAERLARVPNTGRMLIPVWSVKQRQAGEQAANKNKERGLS